MADNKETNQLTKADSLTGCGFILVIIGGCVLFGLWGSYSENMIFTIIAAIVFVIGIFALISGQSEKEKEEKAKGPKYKKVVLDFDTDNNEKDNQEENEGEDNETEYYTYIAGVKYRCDESDIGGFFGYVEPEPDNQHDKNAQAVYRIDGKHLGYIPRNDLEDFKTVSKNKKCPCVGYIKDGTQNPVFGKVKVFRTLDDNTEHDIAMFIRWMIVNLGKKYIPKDLIIEYNGMRPSTKDEWITAVTDYIQQKRDDPSLKSIDVKANFPQIFSKLNN